MDPEFPMDFVIAFPIDPWNGLGRPWDDKLEFRRRLAECPIIVDDYKTFNRGLTFPKAFRAFARILSFSSIHEPSGQK